MSKIIDNFLLPLFVVICILYAFNSLVHAQPQLLKAYHHKVDQPHYLERANVSFYFSDEPHIQETTSKPNTITFFLPNTCIAKGECERSIQALNDKHNGYTIMIKEIMQPAPGLHVTFRLDPNACLLHYESFDSIGLQKGFVFRIYNKQVLATLQKKQDQPILKMLSRDTISYKPCIIIDPGHGGIDSGACNLSIQEKNICLAVGLEVADLLEKNGCSAFLTRATDIFIPLDMRTTVANNNNGDLFVSIHANYAHNTKVRGIETFCLQEQLFKQHQLHPHKNTFISDFLKKRCETSKIVAQSVQSSVCKSVASFHNEPIDRKVKHSVSQVLLGAQMPAILIEVGFLSHKHEVMLLSDKKYQRCIAEGICKGILATIF